MDLEVWVPLMDLEGECVVEMFVLANPATLELASKEYRMGNWGISWQYVSGSRPRGTLSQNWRLFLIIFGGKQIPLENLLLKQKTLSACGSQLFLEKKNLIFSVPRKEMKFGEQVC